MYEHEHVRNAIVAILAAWDAGKIEVSEEHHEELCALLKDAHIALIGGIP